MVLDGAYDLAEERDASLMPLANPQYTAKERDAESGLDYFMARYYSGSLGRFTSPDAPFFDQFPTEPQSWNLFGYVRNNPLVFIDPTGRCSEDGNGGYTDEGEGLFPGLCSEGKIGGDEGAEVTVYAYPQLDPLVAQALRSAGYRAERDIKAFAITAAAGGAATGVGIVAVGGGAAIPETIILSGNIGSRLLPLGMTQAQFGQEVMKWGRFNAAAIARIGKVSLHELQAAGVTRQMAASWRDFYSYVSKIQPNNPSAAGRAELMQHVVDLFDKALKR